MLKFASHSITSPTKFRFPLPENLVELERQFQAASSGEERLRLAQQFTRLVAALRVGHICKTTRWGRLDRSSARLVEFAGADQPVNLLDIGVSDGITTLEAVQAMERAGHRPVTAVGIDLHCELIRKRGFGVAEYESNQGDPVLARIGPFLMTVGRGASPRQPISRWLAGVYLRRKGFRSRFRADLRISLINPLARTHPAIQFAAHNIFAPRSDWEGQFSIVRAANILHREYFSDAEICQIADRLHSYLQPAGMLLVSRNLAPRESPACEENGTVWRKVDGGWEWLADVGNGSCVADLIEGRRVSEVGQ